MLDEDVIRTRGAREFENRYLNKTFDDKVTVIRVLDSRGENFKVRKVYEHKIKVVNIVTVPEIEMLMIFSEGKLADYQKAEKKPSNFCKQNLKMGRNIKSYEFVKDYFSDYNKLVKAIRDYDAYARKNKKLRETKKTLKEMHTLFELLRTV